MLLEVIREVRTETTFKLLAFVVMPDHLHMVVSLPSELRLGRVMQLIKGRFSNRYHRETGGAGNLWQERYHERTLRTSHQLITAIEYVHGNPVKAELVSQVSDFSWSSANPKHDTDLPRYLGSG
jgi:putative transposase